MGLSGDLSGVALRVLSQLPVRLLRREPGGHRFCFGALDSCPRGVGGRCCVGVGAFNGVVGLGGVVLRVLSQLPVRLLRRDPGGHRACLGLSGDLAGDAGLGGVCALGGEAIVGVCC